MRCAADLATPKIETFQVITPEPNELQSSERVQIVAQLILLKKGSHNFFAQVLTFQDN